MKKATIQALREAYKAGNFSGRIIQLQRQFLRQWKRKNNYQFLISNKMKKQEWNYNKGSEPHFQSMVYDQETGQDVAVCYNDEGSKNALLISKAPELLQALKDVDQWIKGFIVKPAFTDEALKAVQEVINNAIQP